jgi:F0F1-type ATP synthase membrane subunit b/b'
MKKIFALMLTMVMALSLVTPAALASEQSNMDLVKEKVAEANLEIDELIEEAVAEGRELLAEYEEAKAEYSGDEKALKEAKKEYNKELDKLINDLIKVTNNISKETQKFGAQHGVEVECEWVTVTIGDRQVEVDPLRVIGKV